MILQRQIPYDVTESRLPGTRPLGDEYWLWVDDAFAGQMAERDRLISAHRDSVIRLGEEAGEAAAELLQTVMDALALRPDYSVSASKVTRPDGATVDLNRPDPMATLGRLVQEDLCILQPGPSGEHRLTAAVLCFPASWTLSEKFMRPLTTIHRPVAEYDAALGARVQRLFDGLQVERPIWRFNCLRYSDPALHAPRSEADPRGEESDADYVRSERQCLLRLPVTRAVVFSIHTFMVHDPEHRIGCGP